MPHSRCGPARGAKTDAGARWAYLDRPNDGFSGDAPSWRFVDDENVMLMLACIGGGGVAQCWKHVLLKLAGFAQHLTQLGHRNLGSFAVLYDEPLPMHGVGSALQRTCELAKRRRAFESALLMRCLG